MEYLGKRIDSIKALSLATLISILFTGNVAFTKLIDDRILIKGHVFTKDEKQPLAYVNLFPEACNYGTFTNHDGSFELLVHKNDYGKNLVASLIGYHDEIFPMDTARSYQIFMSPQDRKAVNSENFAADAIMDNFRNNAKSNYPTNPMVKRVFLREYGRIRDEENLYMNEVIIDYLRQGYFDKQEDKMKLIKGRNKIYDEKISFSYSSGGFNDIESDIIKYPKDFIMSSKGYEFSIVEIFTQHGDKVFKIKFEGDGKREYKGFLYIEDKNFALIKAEVDFTEYGREILNRLSKKSGFYWDKLSETIVYKKSGNGKYGLSEIISEGFGYDYNIDKQMIVNSDILVVETDIVGYFANEFHKVEDQVSIFELDFEATEYFWEENNYVLLEDSFLEGYD